MNIQTFKISHNTLFLVKVALLSMTIACSNKPKLSDKEKTLDRRVDSVLSRMNAKEKIDQMLVFNLDRKLDTNAIKKAFKENHFGAIISVTPYNAKLCNWLQDLSKRESRVGIPFLFGADVIHGYRTIFPVPLAQAATWDLELVRNAASVAANEASASGINWTYAPMVDVCRDPRWGRVIETLGEDPYLSSVLAASMVKGFQGENLTNPEHIAACAKHYIGYGAVSGGRDYNNTLIPEQELREVHLPSFKACVDADVASVMSAYTEINGIPASGNIFTIRKLLKEELKFKGFVTSDWGSIWDMIGLGYAEDCEQAAFKAVTAGVDLELTKACYTENLNKLLTSGKIDEKLIDDAVRRILRIKFKLGLFDNRRNDASRESVFLNHDHIRLAYEMALNSIVLLKNENNILPLSHNQKNIAIIGPLADDAFDQMGAWTVYGKPEEATTPLKALINQYKDISFSYTAGLSNPLSTETTGFTEAIQLAKKADAIVLFLGENSKIEGEGRSRAFLDLPGAQEELALELFKTGKPVIIVIMAGRPLTFGRLAEKATAILYAWHPGTMGGPAIADLIYGKSSPCGKLPITFPRTVGQIPIYYYRKNFKAESTGTLDSINFGKPILTDDYFSSYIDVKQTPQFPFGYGLSYTTFNYSQLTQSAKKISFRDTLVISAWIKNSGKYSGQEIAQLYIRDIIGSVTRPIRQLKGFRKISLSPSDSVCVQFKLTSADLAFWDENMKFKPEAGQFNFWIAPSSVGGLQGSFELVEKK